jgi:HK97 family phage portal protein
MGAIAKLRSWLSPGNEGQYRPGPYWTFEQGGGWIPANSPWNFWQCGIDPQPFSATAMAEACVAAYAQTIAMCPGAHWRLLGDGGREKVETSALSRILQRPNGYQSASDFMVNLVRSLYYSGNAYALALRNDRFEVDELHWMSPWSSHYQLAADGSLFYKLSGNNVVAKQLADQGLDTLLNAVPARNVLHIRLECPRDPLVGETPLTYAALSLANSNAAIAAQMSMLANGGRPNGVIIHPKMLGHDQVAETKAQWMKSTAGPVGQSPPPILMNGMTFMPTAGLTSSDAQIIEALKWTNQDVARAFRVPLPIVGEGDRTGFATTEALMQFWLASGLGFAINHVELAYDKFFGIDRTNEYTEFSTDVLLRSAFRERIEGLARAVTSGIMAPNEARASEELSAVDRGDEPRVQQQMVPLSWEPPKPQPPQPPKPPGPPPEPPSPGSGQPAAKQLSVGEIKARMHHELDRIAA